MSALCKRSRKCRVIENLNEDSIEHQGTSKFVVIGGGISGLCCVQELARLVSSNDRSGIEIVLVTASSLLKEVCRPSLCSCVVSLCLSKPMFIAKTYYTKTC